MNECLTLRNFKIYRRVLESRIIKRTQKHPLPCSTNEQVYNTHPTHAQRKRDRDFETLDILLNCPVRDKSLLKYAVT